MEALSFTNIFLVLFFLKVFLSVLRWVFKTQPVLKFKLVSPNATPPYKGNKYAAVNVLYKSFIFLNIIFLGI